jgi:hypothetical protein
VITGFNTDVEYNGEIYHVQTEDKGLRTAMIVSLIYQGGTILASKRSSYSDLLVDGAVADKKALTERVHKQHKLICAAIKAGRIEDLKRLTAREAAISAKEVAAEKEVLKKKTAALESEKVVDEVSEVKQAVVPPEAIVTEEIADAEIVEMPIDVIEEVSEAEIVEEIEELETIEAAEAIEEAVEVEETQEEIEREIEEVEEAVLASVVSPVGETLEFSEEEKSLKENELNIEVLGNPKFKGGDQKVLSLLVTQGQNKQVVNGSQVTVKVLGSSFRPLVYHGETDENGLAIFRLQIPHFKSGKAAILIKVSYNGEEVEVKQLVKPG